MVLQDSSWLDSLLKPFEGIDLLSIYLSYSSLFDFFIFFVIFLGLSQSILHKRFEGRGGNAVIVGLSIALSFGMLFAERSYGFSLRSLGGIGFAIFLILVAILTFNVVFKATKLTLIMKVCIAYITTFILLNLVANKFFLYIARKIPFFNGVFVLCLLIACIRLLIEISSNWGKLKKDSLGTINKGLSGFKNAIKKVKPEINEVGRERRIEKKNIEKPIKTEKKEVKTIIDELDSLIEKITEFELNGQGGKQIIKLLSDIISREHHLSDKINEIKINTKKLESWDFGLLRQFKSEYNSLSEKSKKYISKEILDERRKIGVEEKLKRTEELLAKLDSNFKYTLKEGIANLKIKNFDQAKISIERARKFELGSKRVLEELENLEKHLVKLTIKGMRLLKRLKHSNK